MNSLGKANYGDGMNSLPLEILEHYEPLTRIGEGQYGEVFLAVDKETGEKVALKKNKISNDKDGVWLIIFSLVINLK